MFSGGKSLQRPEAKFLQWQRVKIAHVVDFTTSKFFTFNDCFSLPRTKLVLKCCKAHNFGPPKATHIYYKIFFDLHPLYRLKMHILPTSSKQNTFSDQQSECQKTLKRHIKICCDLSDLSAQLTVYNTRWNALMQSCNNTIIH